MIPDDVSVLETLTVADISNIASSPLPSFMNLFGKSKLTQD
jgi:hypothetical protein